MEIEKRSSSNSSWFMFMQQAGNRDPSRAKVLTPKLRYQLLY